MGNLARRERTADHDDDREDDHMLIKTMTTKNDDDNHDDEEECTTLRGGSGEGRDQSRGSKATSGEAHSVTWVTLGS